MMALSGRLALAVQTNRSPDLREVLRRRATDRTHVADTLHGLLLLVEAHAPPAVLAVELGLDPQRLTKVLEAARDGNGKPEGFPAPRRAAGPESEPAEERAAEPEPVPHLPPVHPSFRQDTRVLVEVAEAHGIGLRELIGHSRRPIAVAARREAAWRLRHELRRPLDDIGRTLNRDHTSILHALRRQAAILAERERGS